MEYFSTFLTGFGSPVTRELKKQVPDIKIKVLLDGLVSFSTAADQALIKGLDFLNNTYIQLDCVRLNKQKATPPYLNNQNIWVVERSEGFLFKGEKLTTQVKPYLEKGQLKPDLAYLMCLLSDPNESDTFLDPFSGSGAIPIERLKFPAEKILAGDMDGKVSEKLKARSQKQNWPITVGKWDALNLSNFDDETIDKIVTDPPWGLYLGKRLDLQMFYSKMLKEFFRVLKPNGIVVILVSNKELMEKILRESGKFTLLEKYSTIVNGQKAGVYKIKKVII